MEEKFKKFFKEVYKASQYDAQGDADHACEHYSPSEVLD